MTPVNSNFPCILTCYHVQVVPPTPSGIIFTHQNTITTSFIVAMYNGNPNEISKDDKQNRKKKARVAFDVFQLEQFTPQSFLL